MSDLPTTSESADIDHPMDRHGRFEPIRPRTGRAAVVKAILYRRLQLAFALFVLLLLIALGMLAALGWTNRERLDMIAGGVAHTHSLQGAGLEMRHLQVGDLTGTAELRQESLSALARAVAPLSAPGVLLVPENARRMEQVDALLTGDERPPRDRLSAALELLRQTSYSEIDAVSRMLETAERDAAAESSLSVAALLVLPALLSVAVWLLLRRIFRPIDDLTELLQRLGQGEPSPIRATRADPLLLPLLDNYNAMIGRLAELEQARRASAESLRGEVHTATQALLEQHRSLARAERLAAAGELAASVAHELRNPLAGIQMALTNLRRDLEDPAATQRLDLAIGEIERIGRLLKGLLDQARAEPEPSTAIDLAVLVEELLTLVRYQAPPQVEIRSDIPRGVRCLLPGNRLRQAILNLVLNAIHALNDQPGEILVVANLEGDQLRLTVTDEGPGFPAEFLAAPIQSFRTGRPSGTGLGLAMVRRLVRDLGGRLELSNRDPHGARAALILPCGAST